MEESTNALTTRKVGIRFGLILAVTSIILFLIITVSGMSMAGPIKWAFYPVYVVIIYFAHKMYKDNGNGYMTYPQGMSIVFWLSLISSIISSIFTYIYIKFIDSSFMDMIRDQQIKEFESKGLSDEKIEQALKIAEKFTTPEAILIFGIVGGIIGIVIIGLIVTIFTQKKNPEQAF